MRRLRYRNEAGGGVPAALVAASAMDGSGSPGYSAANAPLHRSIWSTCPRDVFAVSDRYGRLRATA
jgi:hypothetical protein